MSAKSPNPAKVARRNMQKAGRLSYAACQVFALETKTLLQRHADTLLTPVIEPVLEQFTSGLISPTELLHKLAEVHYTVQVFTDLAAEEDNHARNGASLWDTGIMAARSLLARRLARDHDVSHEDAQQQIEEVTADETIEQILRRLGLDS